MIEWLENYWVWVLVVILLTLLIGGNYNRIDRFLHKKEWADKGSAGERELYNYLTNVLTYPKGMIYRNLLIADEKGKRTEIDLILLYKYGVVVFEMKNYSGEIFGDEKNKLWGNRYGRKTYRFYNPIMQNERHIEALKKKLENNKLKFYSIIVFGDKATIRKMTYTAKNTWVGKMSSLDKVDKLIRSGTQINIGDEDAKKIKEFLRRSERNRDNVFADRR